MGEQIRARVQYGDMRGTIAIDGWDGMATVSLGGQRANGYWPVGIEFYCEPEKKGGKFREHVYLLCVDAGILDGSGPDAVKKYARENGELPVFRFLTTLKMQDVIGNVKRLSIVLQDRSTVDVPLVLVGGDSTYQPDDDDHA